MTYEDDFLQFEWGIRGMRPMRISCMKAGVQWPPPKTINFVGCDFTLESYSQITDEQRAGMTHICRGALYKVD